MRILEYRISACPAIAAAAPRRAVLEAHSDAARPLPRWPGCAPLSAAGRAPGRRVIGDRLRDGGGGRTQCGFARPCRRMIRAGNDPYLDRRRLRAAKNGISSCCRSKTTRSADADRANEVARLVIDENSSCGGHQAAPTYGGQSAEECRDFLRPVGELSTRKAPTQGAPRLSARDVAAQNSRAVLALDGNIVASSVEHEDRQRRAAQLGTPRQRTINHADGQIQCESCPSRSSLLCTEHEKDGVATTALSYALAALVRCGRHTAKARVRSSERRGEQPRHVEAVAPRAITDLLSAARAVGDNHCIARRAAQLRQ